MKKLGKAMAAVVLIAVLAFTAVFLINAYNKGTFGNKAEKVEDTFLRDIQGTWNGKYKISGLTFNEDGTTSLNMLGVSVDGTYSDKFDLENETHTLTLKYSTILGVSVERSFIAKLEDDKLMLTDTQLDSVEMVYTRDKYELSTIPEGESQSTTETTTVYNPGIDVYEAALVGEWQSTLATTSGYKFIDAESVTIKLLGVSYDGTYSVSIDNVTNRCMLTINYANLLGVNVSNTYFLSIVDDSMMLTQKGAESLTLDYKKVA